MSRILSCKFCGVSGSIAGNFPFAKHLVLKMIFLYSMLNSCYGAPPEQNFWLRPMPNNHQGSGAAHQQLQQQRQRVTSRFSVPLPQQVFVNQQQPPQYHAPPPAAQPAPQMMGPSPNGAAGINRRPSDKLNKTVYMAVTAQGNTGRSPSARLLFGNQQQPPPLPPRAPPPPQMPMFEPPPPQANGVMQFKQRNMSVQRNPLSAVYLAATQKSSHQQTPQPDLLHQPGKPAGDGQTVYMAFTSHFGRVEQEPHSLIVHMRWDYWIRDPSKQYSIGFYVDRKEQESVNFELLCAFDTNDFGQFGVSGLKHFQNCRPLPQPKDRFLALVHPTKNPYEIRVINHFEEYDMMDNAAANHDFSPSGEREFSFRRLRKPMEHFYELEKWVQQKRGMRAFFENISL